MGDSVGLFLIISHTSGLENTMYAAITFDKVKRQVHVTAFDVEEHACILKMQERMHRYKDYAFLIMPIGNKDAGAPDLMNWLESLGFKKETALGVMAGVSERIKSVLEDQNEVTRRLILPG